jgi:hypothetical protein
MLEGFIVEGFGQVTPLILLSLNDLLISKT